MDDMVETPPVKKCQRWMAMCTCSREEGHEGAHWCESELCGGRWYGDVDDTISKIGPESRLPFAYGMGPMFDSMFNPVSQEGQADEG